MSSLPSFVDLTDSLDLEQEQTSTAVQSRSPAKKNARARSSSSPSRTTLRHRYSPYLALVRGLAFYLIYT
jgi:hypothetical protein